MKQMKQNVISNPSHTRRLLMENPQLAYALLQVIIETFFVIDSFQAQVVMRVVDPKVAYSMLHREVPATQQPFHQLPVSSTNGCKSFFVILHYRVKAVHILRQRMVFRYCRNKFNKRKFSNLVAFPFVSSIFCASLISLVALHSAFFRTLPPFPRYRSH